MNKKRIIFQDFIFFIVTLIIFIISITSINYKSKLDSVNNLENYITIVSNIYNKDEDTRYSRIGGELCGKSKISDADGADVLHFALSKRRMLWYGYSG